MGTTRLNKSIKNARVNLVFYAVILFVSFFSRKIFLQSLGDEFVGLSSTLFNILGVINIAELGIGSAVAYMLYKPLFENDTKKINEIISVFGYMYQKIGIIVACVAALLIPFLHLFFKDTQVSLPVIYFAYTSFTLSSLLGYFVNYKQLLLAADQRNYVVTWYFQSSNIIRLIIQLLIAKYTGNFYLWIAVEMISAATYSYLISRKVNKIYPFLKSNIKSGRSLFKAYPELITKTKQIFAHKLGGVVLINLSPLILFSYSSATMVTFYTNYTLIMSKLAQLAAHLLSSIDAAVGSVIAEGNQEMIKRVYWEIISLYYLIAGVIVISLYFLINPFISILFGVEYILPHLTVIIILINFYFSITRVCNDIFLAAYGLFRDVWAPIAEAVISVSISIIGGIYFGTNGVLCGTLVSVLIIVKGWKPYFLFKNGIKERLSSYWLTISKHVLITIITFITLYYISPVIIIDAASNYFNWTLYALIIFSASGLTMLSLMLISSRGMRNASSRILKNILKK